MFIPLGDENRPQAATPVVTWSLLAINIAVFLLQISAGDPFTYGWSMVPWEITHGTDRVGVEFILVDGKPVRTEDGRLLVRRHYEFPYWIYLTILTSMFMHADILHLLGNMLYLWIFGDNLEDNMGHGRFLLFYLLCGIGAALAHVLAGPQSTVPTLGASGAISGVLGGYLVLFPHSRVFVLVVRVIVPLPAYVALGIWIGMQLLFSVLDSTPGGGGVAYMAHIGGFVAGALLIFLFRRPDWVLPVAKRRGQVHRWLPPQQRRRMI